MKLRSLFGLLLASLLTLAMFGCGDNGGGSTTTVKGTAAANAVVGGTVSFFPVILDSTGSPTKGTKLTTTPAVVTTKTFGNYSASFGYSGPLLIEVTGGTYTDEASGVANVPNTKLSAAVDNATGTITNISVTPITSLIVNTSAKPAAGQTLAAFIKAANAGIAKALGLPSTLDITKTPVSDPTYTFALQTISKAAQTQSNGSTDPATLGAAAGTVVTNLGSAINPVTGTITDPIIIQQIIQAKQGAFTQFTPDPTVIDPKTPAGVTLTASPATGVINNNVTITANVSALSSAATVADGTTVTFTTSAGTITASATTTSGVATATLNGISTAQNGIIVTAAVTSGTVTVASAPLTVNFITDPNAPTAISIAANPTTIFVGGTSTLTATVTPGTGGTIANGTVVTFTTTLGTITNPTATTGGVATATLTSSVAGTASVTASVNGILSTPVSVTVNAAPTKAIVKIATTGTLPAGGTIDAAQLILNYVTNKGLSITGTVPPAANPDIIASGVATSTLILPNAGTPGVVNTAFANLPVGATLPPLATQTGEFATFTFSIATANPPNIPVIGDFTIDPTSTITTTSTPATTLSFIVLSLTLQ